MTAIVAETVAVFSYTQLKEHEMKTCTYFQIYEEGLGELRIQCDMTLDDAHKFFNNVQRTFVVAGIEYNPEGKSSVRLTPITAYSKVAHETELSERPAANRPKKLT